MPDEKKYTACLFLGGPMDGQFVPVDDALDAYHVQAPCAHMIGVPKADSCFEYTIIVYRREVLTEQSKQYYLFTCLPDTATRIGRLMLGYKSLSVNH